MGFADLVARARAGSILRSPTPSSPTQGASSHTQFTEKHGLNEKQPYGDPRASLVQNAGRHGNDNEAHNERSHIAVRTVPTWVRVLDDDDEEATQATTRLLPSSPSNIQVAEHHYHSSDLPVRPKPPRGRLHDQERESAPPLPRGHPGEHISQWRSFVNASSYPAIRSDGGRVVTPRWLAQHGPDYSKPWMAGHEEGKVENARAFSAKKFQRTIIRNPMIPLIIRSVVWVFSLIALAVAASIHHITKRASKQGNTASTEMAIVVDATAMVYLFYITWDEYSSKPLGLRSARAKMRLIFLDLFFIVFDSANLSLAFEAAHRQGICQAGTENELLCHRQNALASVLLIALIAWLLTFGISVLRLVERVTRK